MTNIFSTFFWNILEGKIQRKTFIIYIIALFIITISFYSLTLQWIIWAENFIGWNLQEAQAKITEVVAMPYLALMAIFLISTFYAWLVLIVKRLRDTGLKWGILALSVFLTYIIWFLTIILMVIPTNYFKKDK
jgi:uncharacterized membrane protein YhaH (DUF805 family)